MVKLLERDLLAIYLNDHLGGSSGGLELARRAAEQNKGTQLGRFLEKLAKEIEEDREALKEIMDAVGVGRDHLKVAAGWTLEKFGRLKVNGRLIEYSPLSRLVEIEGLIVGVRGKLAGWHSLLAVVDEVEGLKRTQLERLEQRANRQLEGLAKHHRRVAAEALVERG
jgi:hypothetical protein